MVKSTKSPNFALMKTFLELITEVGIFLCIRGQQTLLINGQSITLRAGMLCIKSPIFVFQTLSQSDDFEACTIFADANTIFPILRASLNIVKDFRIIEHPFIELSSDMIRFVMERADKIKQDRAALETVKDANEHFLLSQSIRLYIQQTFADFLLSYYRANPVVSTRGDNRGYMVFQFVFSLHQNFHEHRSVQFYAEQAHLSTGHFSSLVKSVLGCTPSDMIAFITIANIKVSLKQTSKSIKEIADDFNFPEQFTFRKYFKTHTGMSPKEFRQME